MLNILNYLTKQCHIEGVNLFPPKLYKKPILAF